uniref:Uncharacterized protein n=1 Tax=Anopheles coluzzii TaxID=1518534 RepID=A0A8W7P9V4_ANOCL
MERKRQEKVPGPLRLRGLLVYFGRICLLAAAEVILNVLQRSALRFGQEEVHEHDAQQGDQSEEQEHILITDRTDHRRVALQYDERHGVAEEDRQPGREATDLAFIEKGSVRKPSVAVKINATSSAVGIQLYCVSATGNTAHAASPNIQHAIPNPENRAGGRRPNLSEMNDIRMVVTTRVSPTSTALRNGSIATPASTEKLAAYTIMTKMPENC